LDQRQQQQPKHQLFPNHTSIHPPIDRSTAAAAMGSLISRVLDSLSALGGKHDKRILYVVGWGVDARSIQFGADIFFGF
jgi:hypothetical protein